MVLSKNSTKILVISHFLISPLENAASSSIIRDFLKDKAFRITQVELPFSDSRENYLYKLIFENGEVKKEEKMKIIKKPDWLAYIIHPLISFFLVFKDFKGFDLCIACENLSFIAMFPLRKVGIIKRIVYYSVDYVEVRFSNRIINNMYHWFDRVACNNSDVNWVVNEKQIQGRKNNGVNISKCSSFEVVPIAFRNKDIEVLPVEKISYYNLMFCGTLRDSAGPDLVVKALPYLLKRFPKIKATFVGNGEAKNKLVKLARDLKVSRRIVFYHNVSKQSEVVKILTKGSIGLAPYTPYPGSISFNSDPGKIKLYLACGLPVITTNIATSGRRIQKNKAGLVVNYSEKELAKAIIYLLQNRKRYTVYKEASIRLSEKYDADVVLKKAFRYLSN